MATKKPKAPVAASPEAAPASPVEEKYDENNPINNPDFLAFLGKHDDAEKIAEENGERLDEIYESFKKKEKMKEDYIRVVKGKIENELPGLNLVDGDYKDISEYIDKLAIENPEQLADIHRTATTYEQMPERIKELEVSIEATLSTSKELSELTEMKNEIHGTTMSRAIKYFKKWIPGRKRRDALEIEAQEKEMMAELDEQIAELQTRLDELTGEDLEKWGPGGAKAELNELKARAIKVKKHMANEINSFEGLSSIIQIKCKERVRSLIETGNFEDIVQAQTELERYIDDTNFSIETITPEEVKELQKELREAVEYGVEVHMAQAVDEMDLTKGPYSQLEKELKKYLETANLGGYAGNDKIDLVVNSLEKALKDYEEGPKDQKVKMTVSLPRKLVARRMIGHLKSLKKK